MNALSLVYLAFVAFLVWQVFLYAIRSIGKAWRNED